MLHAGLLLALGRRGLGRHGCWTREDERGSVVIQISRESKGEGGSGEGEIDL